MTQSDIPAGYLVFLAPNAPVPDEWRKIGQHNVGWVNGAGGPYYVGKTVAVIEKL